MNGRSVSERVADRVRAIRRAKGLTAQALADRAPGLTAQAVSNIETGRRDKDGRRRRAVTVDELMELADALGVTAWQLLAADPECGTCHGSPPQGFCCLACGVSRS